MTNTIKNETLTQINCPNLNIFKVGKVRTVYDLGKNLLIVASDRISAFDVILPDGIPEKGKTLTQVSQFWFDFTKDIVKNHLISIDSNDFPEQTKPYHDQLKNRSMFVKKTDLIEVECVVRGYLVGSGWKDYQKTQAVCGIKLPENLNLASKLENPIFTPAAKARIGEGHDENISTHEMANRIGQELTEKLKNISLELYTKARNHAEKKGIILADTKFEFGLLNNEIILIDELFTPDSSRFWPQKSYQEGISPPSYDKQIVRDYLETTNWNKTEPGPRLPEEIIKKTQEKYQEIGRILCGK